jgi:hypothetical protein
MCAEPPSNIIFCFSFSFFPSREDQLFGVIVSLILSIGSFQTPSELMEYLLEKLRPKFAAKQELVTGTMLTAVRDFKTWLQPLNRTLWHAFANRQQKEAPHAFTFKQGRELSHAEKMWFGEEASRRLGVEDIYCCVKTYMHSRTLQQEPVLAVPDGRAHLIARAPTDVVARHPLSLDRVKELLKLEMKLLHHGLHIASQALHSMVIDTSWSVPPLPWLSNDGEVAWVDRSDSGNYYFPHLPNSSFRLFAADRA